MVKKPTNNPGKKRQQAIIHQLVTAIDQQPDNYQNYYNLLVILTEGQSFDQAEELAQKALTRFKADAKAQNILKYGLGNVYYQTAHYDLAIQQYQQIDDHKLQNDAYVMVAQALMAKHDYQHALVYAITAHDQQPADKTIELLIADILLALGNNQQAFDFYQQVLNQNDSDGHANFGAGLTAMVIGKPYAAYFAAAKQNDQKYYQEHQEQLVAVEQLVKDQQSKPKSE